MFTSVGLFVFELFYNEFEFLNIIFLHVGTNKKPMLRK